MKFNVNFKKILMKGDITAEDVNITLEFGIREVLFAKEIIKLIETKVDKINEDKLKKEASVKLKEIRDEYVSIQNGANQCFDIDKKINEFIKFIITNEIVKDTDFEKEKYQLIKYLIDTYGEIKQD